MSPTGYLHPGYARSLAEFGTPVELRRSGAWFLKRQIPGHAACDGMGCYPFLTCLDWSALAKDLDEFARDLVSFAAVIDPFGSYTMADLEQAFPDLSIRFKDHHVADLRQPTDKIVSPRRRRRAKAILRTVDVEFHEHPAGLLDQWMSVFQHAVRRFGLTGIPAYSPAAFARQLALPGTIMAVARFKGEVVGAQIYVMYGDTAYGHISAACPKARVLSADDALYLSAIEYFAGKVRWLNWGGEAGIATTTDGKLVSFKRHWSTDTRPVYFCGRICDEQRYHEITRAKGASSQGYFPAYRVGEFD